MTASSDQGMPAFMTTEQLAQRWQLSPRTLERWRSEGYGPAWVILGGTVRYRCDDARNYEAAGRRGDDVARDDRS